MIRHLVSASVKGTRMLCNRHDMSCSQYSKTRKTFLQSTPVTTRSRLMMFGCRELCGIFTSRRAVMGIPSLSLSMRTFFIATMDPSRLSARYTTPYVPSQMRPNFS